MSLTAAILDALVEAGATREQIAAVVRADIAERGAEADARLAAKREGNRERQQRKRANDASRDVTLVTRDERDPSPNEENLTPTRKLPPKPIGLDPKPKKHRLPDDWQPAPFSPGTMAAQIVQRWEPGRLERELAKFRAHYAAAGTKWENWQAVWCKWVNNADDFQRGPTSGQQRQPSSKTADTWALLDQSDDPY